MNTYSIEKNKFKINCNRVEQNKCKIAILFGAFIQKKKFYLQNEIILILTGISINR